jgi:hypothetical protein
MWKNSKKVTDAFFGENDRGKKIDSRNRCKQTFLNQQLKVQILE